MYMFKYVCKCCYTCMYLYTFLFSWESPNPPPVFRGRMSFGCYVFGSVHFLHIWKHHDFFQIFKLSKLLWSILKCRGKQVMHSWHCWYAGWLQFYNEKKTVKITHMIPMFKTFMIIPVWLGGILTVDCCTPFVTG